MLKKIYKIMLVGLMLVGVFSVNSNVYANTETEPILENGGFEDELDRNDIQTYKAQRVTADEGKVRSGDYSIKVGARRPDNDEDYPLWFFNGGKGSVGLTIRDIEPNTAYRVSGYYYNETGVSMRTGVLDIEGYNSYQPGRLNSKYSSNRSYTPNWVSFSYDITSGPRTTELYAFALTEWTNTEKGAGVFYIDDVTVEKLDTKTAPVEQTIDYNAKDLDNLSETFPDTIPMIQSFTKSDENNQFNLDTKGQLIYTDSESYDKAEYFAKKMVENGIIENYSLSEFDKDTVPTEGIIVLNDSITFEYPSEFEATRHEAYEITISERNIVINAEDVSGVQNGLMTLLQAFQQRSSLPTGKVEDYTTQQIRGLQVDTGRRYYTIDWLKNQVEQMAYQKLNKLQLRLKDNEGIRYDSKVAPQFVDTAGGFWTKEEVKELVHFAREFEIEVIPEIDFPGHSEQDGVYFPKEWLLHPDQSDSRALDFSLPQVREYMADVYKEAFDLFESDIVHMGADEYFQTKNLGSTEKLAQWAKDETGNSSATAKDAYKLFFNELAKPYLDEGKTVLLWNDNIDDLLGPAVELDKRITIDYWASTFYSSISVDEALENGYQIMGSAANLYHDLWPENDKLDRPLPRFLYNSWTQNTYSTGWGYKNIAPNKLSLGQMFPIWDDAHGYVPEYILTRTLFTRLGIFSNLMWGADKDDNGAKKLNFEEIERLIYNLGSVKDEGFEQVRMDYTEGDVEFIVGTIKAALELVDVENLDDTQKEKVKDLELTISNLEDGVSTRSIEDATTYEIIFDLIHQYENINSKEKTYVPVKVEYVDENGKALREAKTLSRSDYDFPLYDEEDVEIAGYLFVGLKEGSSSKSGLFTNKDQTVTFEYKKDDKPVEPTDPVVPTEPKDPADTNGTKPGGKLPSTGMGTSNVLLISSALLVIGGSVYILNKKRRNQSK